MILNTFPPDPSLKRYVKCHWVYSAIKNAPVEKLYPSGFLELAINISNGNLTTIIAGHSVKMPPIEVLGQLTVPGELVVSKGTTLLITRFHPHAGCMFFPERISNFTNNSVDLGAVFKMEANRLFGRILDTGLIASKINIVERFLTARLASTSGRLMKLNMVEDICGKLERADHTFSVKKMAADYGFSERYLQRIFLDATGVTAKTYLSVQRFKKSRRLMQTAGHSLTSVAVESGYYDQSHFIREFKRFTGTTPSEFPGTDSPD